MLHVRLAMDQQILAVYRVLALTSITPSAALPHVLKALMLIRPLLNVQVYTIFYSADYLFLSSFSPGCHISCTACNGPTNSNCSACGPSYYLLAVQQLCTTSCPSPYSPITENKTCMITTVDASTLNLTLHPQIASALSASPPLSLSDAGIFLEGVTDTVVQFKTTNYGTSTASCPECSGNGGCQYSDLYLENQCVCTSGWTGSSCTIPESDIPYLQSLDTKILNEIASKVSQGISLKTSSPSQPYLDSLLKIVSTPPLVSTQVQQVMSIISNIVNNDFNNKTTSDDFDTVKMTTAAQIIDYCLQYAYNTDCLFQQSTSQSLTTSATNALTLLTSLQLWNKAVNSGNYTIDCTDFQLFAMRVYPSDLDGLTISPPNQPSIILKGSSASSSGTTPVDIQILFWKKNLMTCPSVQKEDNSPPPVALSVSVPDTVNQASFAASISADILYPATSGQQYTSCTPGCNLTTIQSNGQNYFQCKCGSISSLSSSEQTLNIFKRSNLFKLARAAALASFNYLQSWAFWMLWGISVWIILTIVCIKMKIIKPLTYREQRAGTGAKTNLPQNLQSVRLQAGWFKTILYGLKVNRALFHYVLISSFIS